MAGQQDHGMAGKQECVEPPATHPCGGHLWVIVRCARHVLGQQKSTQLVGWVAEHPPAYFTRKSGWRPTPRSWSMEVEMVVEGQSVDVRFCSGRSLGNAACDFTCGD